MLEVISLNDISNNTNEHVCIRIRTEDFENRNLSKDAFLSSRSRGRDFPEDECIIRTCFQRDIDRITHSKSFRRLMHKTQVFLSPVGDHYRTRMTHALEVSRIARTMAQGLLLNEDLTEAIALGHDLGHSPFGHAGEFALNEVAPNGFEHNMQSRRVVEKLEKNGSGLNLTYEVRDGIERHTGPLRPQTLEGMLVHLADRIAYLSHDMDDAERAGILDEKDMPENLSKSLGRSPRARINTFVLDCIHASFNSQTIKQSDEMKLAMDELRAFMFERVYLNPVAKAEEVKAKDIIRRLFDHYCKNKNELPADVLLLSERDGLEQSVVDFIAGMTDRYAADLAYGLFIPHGWSRK